MVTEQNVREQETKWHTRESMDDCSAAKMDLTLNLYWDKPGQ